MTKREVQAPMSGVETVEVVIPTDGSVEPCEICGAVTVDLDGNPQPCSYHDFCPACGGTKKDFAGPQYCPIHECGEYSNNPIDPRRCSLHRDHDGPCIAWATGGLTFTQWDILGAPVDVQRCVGHRHEGDRAVPIHRWHREIARDVRLSFGDVEVNGYPFSRWKRA